MYVENAVFLYRGWFRFGILLLATLRENKRNRRVDGTDLNWDEWPGTI